MKVWLPAIRSGTGTDVFTLRLQQALAKRGVESSITWFPLWMELFPHFLRRAKIPRDVDVIHANGWAGAAFVRRGVPVVVTVHHLVHDPAYAQFKSPVQALYHRLHLRRRELTALRGASAVTAVSGYVAGTVEAFGCPQPVLVVHNWVDSDDFIPTLLPRSDGPFRLFLPGNLSRRKGFDLLPVLVEALGPEFEVRCTTGLRGVGMGNFGRTVVDLGRLTERQLIAEYQGCDAVVSLSRYEGFGYTAVEAMACGKPFIGFWTSGLGEVVPVDAGFLVPIESIESMALQISALRDDAGRGAALGDAGRQHVLRNFSQGNASKYVGVYETALRERPRQSVRVS